MEVRFMESADLLIFQMVAREGSITKAATRLDYVQSNVTARVRHLESELGAVLFHRHNRGMTLSSEGKTLLGYAEKIVGLMDEAMKALSGEEPNGSLLIGSSQTAAAVRLPKLLAAYYERHPQVRLSLTTGDTTFLMDKVLHYELDGAFIGCACNHPDLQSYPAFDEELVIASATSVSSLEAAVTKPILVLSMGCLYRDILEQWLRSEGLLQPIIMEFGTLEAIVGGVSAGLGISLLPKSVIRIREEEGMVRSHAIPSAFSHMKTEFITRKGSYVSSALSTLIEMLSSTDVFEVRVPV
jgi:LysR family transcriptional regulator, cell division regulator